MKDTNKTKVQLIKELEALRKRNAELEAKTGQGAAVPVRIEKEFILSTIDAMADTFFVFDPVKKKALLWNKAFREVSGYTDDEIAAMKAPDEWYSIQDLKWADAATALSFEEGHATVEMSLITKEGTAIPFEYIGSMIPDAQGKPKYLVSIGRDISEHRLVEEYLEWQLKATLALVQLFRPLISPASDIEDIAHAVLGQAKILTGSAHGIVSVIDPETGDNVGHTLTKVEKKGYEVTKERRKIVFSKGIDGRYPGLWGHALNTHEPFYTNSAGKHPAAQGVPEGHFPIRRFLSVPVLIGKEPVGQISLANPPQNFSERELDVVLRLSEFYALAIERLRAGK
jgi:PAS domain S-box-containing protein